MGAGKSKQVAESARTVLARRALEAETSNITKNAVVENSVKNVPVSSSAQEPLSKSAQDDLAYRAYASQYMDPKLLEQISKWEVVHDKKKKKQQSMMSGEETIAMKTPAVMVRIKEQKERDRMMKETGVVKVDGRLSEKRLNSMLQALRESEVDSDKPTVTTAGAALEYRLPEAVVKRLVQYVKYPVIEYRGKEEYPVGR